MGIQKLRAARFKLLYGLYQLSGGDTFKSYSLHDIGQQPGFGRDLTDRIGEYLKEERLIQYQTFGPTIIITHDGVEQVETILSKPKELGTLLRSIGVPSETLDKPLQLRKHSTMADDERAKSAASPQGRDRVFFCYSRDDENWLKDFLKMLVPPMKNKAINVWYDKPTAHTAVRVIPRDK